MGVTHVGLVPCYALGQFAPNSDDPLWDLRIKPKLKGCSSGIQINPQLDSLWRTLGAKELPKATKGGDRVIPVYLWNQRIKGCADPEKWDKALTGFRRFGMLLFLKSLRCDSICYLVETYGKNSGLCMLGKGEVNWLLWVRINSTLLTWPATPFTQIGLSTKLVQDWSICVFYYVIKGWLVMVFWFSLSTLAPHIRNLNLLTTPHLSALEFGASWKRSCIEGACWGWE